MTESGGSSEAPLPLVLDTSVAVKWYLPEDLHDEAISLLRHAEARTIELLAPGTVQPEFFNALWWQYRREGLPLDSVRNLWRQFALDPVILYAPEDLMPRAAEIALQTRVIIYDGLFLASPRTRKRSSSPLTESSSKPSKARPTPTSRTL